MLFLVITSSVPKKTSNSEGSHWKISEHSGLRKSRSSGVCTGSCKVWPLPIHEIQSSTPQKSLGKILLWSLMRGWIDGCTRSKIRQLEPGCQSLSFYNDGNKPNGNVIVDYGILNRLGNSSVRFTSKLAFIAFTSQPSRFRFSAMK